MGVTEVMIARKIVGSYVRASGGVDVEVGSSMTDMALPLIRRCWTCLCLSLRSCHNISTEVDESDC